MFSCLVFTIVLAWGEILSVIFFQVTAFKSPIWKDFGAEWCGFSRYTKEYVLWLINMLKKSNWNVWFTKTYITCVYCFFIDNIYWFTNKHIYVYIYIYVYTMYIYIYIYIDFLQCILDVWPQYRFFKVAVVPICRALKSNHDQLTRGQDWNHLRSVANHRFSDFVVCFMFSIEPSNAQGTVPSGSLW